jgi:hypothetical protein
VIYKVSSHLISTASYDSRKLLADKQIVLLRMVLFCIYEIVRLTNQSVATNFNKKYIQKQSLVLTKPVDESALDDDFDSNERRIMGDGGWFWNPRLENLKSLRFSFSDFRSDPKAIVIENQWVKNSHR